MNVPTLLTLSNGMTLAAYENPASPTEIVSGLIPVGAVDEPGERRGLAGITASLLARGTTSRDYDALNDAIESVGAGVGFWSGIHNTGFSAKALREDFAAIIGIASDMLRQPTFPGEHFERVRTQRLIGLREREQNPAAIADLLFSQALYPPTHPFHHDPAGTQESISAIQRKEIVAFHRATYSPSGGFLVMVGALPPQQALEIAAIHLDDWQGRDVPVRDMPSLNPMRARTGRIIEGKQQSSLIYGVAAVPRTHPDFMALQLANMVLGGFGMMGRIGTVVRDEMGLAYSARSTLESTKGQGAWAASAGVAPENVGKAVEAIRTEWLRLAKEPVPSDELNDSKALLKGSLPLRLETNEGLARTWLDIIYYGLGFDYLETYHQRVDSITADDILRVTQTYFDPDKAVLAVAGP